MVYCPDTWHYMHSSTFNNKHKDNLYYKLDNKLINTKEGAARFLYLNNKDENNNIYLPIESDFKEDYF